MTESQVTALAAELADASARRQFVPVPPSARFDGFDLASAYAVEAERARSRRATGRVTVGRKVGYANKALWRVLNIDTLLWAHMYDDTVHYAQGNTAILSVASLIAPKIEPEIVFKLRTPLAARAEDAVGVLAAVEWLALGFQVVDCMFPDWSTSRPISSPASAFTRLSSSAIQCTSIPRTRKRSRRRFHGSSCGSPGAENWPTRDRGRTRCAAPRCVSASWRRRFLVSRTRHPSRPVSS